MSTFYVDVCHCHNIRIKYVHYIVHIEQRTICLIWRKRYLIISWDPPWSILTTSSLLLQGATNFIIY